MLKFSFQLYGFQVMFNPSFATRHGPSSNSNPVSDDCPGPPGSEQRFSVVPRRTSVVYAPFVQYTKSEVSGEFLDSKNLGGGVTDDLKPRNERGPPEEQVFSVSNVKVARVLLHARITDLWFRQTEAVVIERRVCDQLV